MCHIVKGTGGKEESEATYGRFNRELAIQRATQKGREDLVTIFDGDDRKEFLGACGPEVLMWWELMDKNNLLYFFAGRLGQSNRAVCDETPAATARGSGDSNKAQKTNRESLQREMVANVGRMEKAVSASVATDITVQLEKMEDKEMDLEEAIEDLDPRTDARRIEKLQTRLNKLRQRKMDLESNLTDVSRPPVDLFNQN